jgi:hypothetical protein
MLTFLKAMLPNRPMNRLVKLGIYVTTRVMQEEPGPAQMSLVMFKILTLGTVMKTAKPIVLLILRPRLCVLRPDQDTDTIRGAGQVQVGWSSAIKCEVRRAF